MSFQSTLTVKMDLIKNLLKRKILKLIVCRRSKRNTRLSRAKKIQRVAPKLAEAPVDGVSPPIEEQNIEMQGIADEPLVLSPLTEEQNVKAAVRR